jgi:hypothetical protein
VQVVDRVLQRRGERVVVLRHDEHEGVGRVDARAPVPGVLVLVLLEPGVMRFVHQRERQLGQVTDLYVESAVLAREREEPVPDDRAYPAGAGTRDDDLQRRHGLPLDD